MVLAVTHSLWGWCQLRSATGMTWCSPLLWHYSSSASIASGDIIPILLTSATSGLKNVIYCGRNKAAPATIVTSQGESDQENDLWMWNRLLNSLPPPPPPPKLPHHPPPRLPLPPCMNITSGFSFEVDHLCPPPRQLAQRPPSFFYTEVRNWNAEPLPSGSAAG